MPSYPVGSPAIDRNAYGSAGQTAIEVNRVCTVAGILKTARIWAVTNMSGCKIASFYNTGGSDWKCRDVEVIGDVTSGSEQEFPGLSLQFEVGDAIGIYFTAGSVEVASSGGAVGIYVKTSHDGCVVDDEETYTGIAYYQVSFEGEITVSGLTKTVSLSTLLEAVDSKTVALDTMVRATDTKTVSLSTLLKGFAVEETVDIDALLKGSATQTVDLSAYLSAIGVLYGWRKRLKITISQADIDAAQANFPIMVKLSTSSGKTSKDVSAVFDELASDANRKKIAVTTSDGFTQCYVEIEKWDDASETAWLHVKLPAITSDADTYLYLYYDSTQDDNDTYVGDTNSAPAENVWDSNFKFVSHMNDNPDTSHIKDSTQYGNDGSKTGANDPPEGTGLIGKAQEYTYYPDTNKITVADDDSLDFGDDTFTVEILLKQVSTYGDLLGKYQFLDNAWGLTCLYGTTMRFYLDKDNAAPEISIDDIRNSWNYLAAVFDRSTDDIYLYQQGSLAGSNSFTAQSFTNAVPFTIGKFTSEQWGGLGGLIDEVRLSDIQRSADWIAITNLSLTDALLTFSDEETLKYEEITLDAILRATDTKTVTMDALLKGFAIEGTVDLDVRVIALGDTKTVALDVILVAYPEKAANYILEIHQASTGNLISILNQAYKIRFVEVANEPLSLNFKLPADDSKKDDLDIANEIWIRDYRTGTLIQKFRLDTVGDRR